MKKLFAPLLLLCVYMVHAQENLQKNKLKFFDEFGISLNHTNVGDDNTLDKNGFGAKGLFNLRPEKKLAMFLGIEYTRTHQLKKTMNEGNFSNLSDVDVYISSVGAPFNLRYCWGENTLLFIDAGGFVELHTGTKTSGTYHSYLPDENNLLVYKTGPYEGHLENITPFNIGFSAGIGIKVKLPKRFVLLKTSYKQGLHPVLDLYNNVNNNCLGIELGIGIR